MQGTIEPVEGCVVMNLEDVEDPFGVERPPGTTWDEDANAARPLRRKAREHRRLHRGGAGGHGLDESRVTPEVRVALEGCSIEWVLHLWGGILTREAATNFPDN